MLDADQYCRVYSNKLKERYLENEGLVPYCEKCGEFRFRMFNTAISAIVYNPAGDKILLIQQYGRKDNILVAGYINLGESAEQTLVREIQEELGLEIVNYQFNASEYFSKSNTLMINFACQVSSDDLSNVNEEIDAWHWYSLDEVKTKILHSSLAEKFLITWLNKCEK